MLEKPGVFRLSLTQVPLTRRLRVPSFRWSTSNWVWGFPHSHRTFPFCPSQVLLFRYSFSQNWVMELLLRSLILFPELQEVSDCHHSFVSYQAKVLGPFFSGMPSLHPILVSSEIPPLVGSSWKLGTWTYLSLVFPSTRGLKLPPPVGGLLKAGSTETPSTLLCQASGELRSLGWRCCVWGFAFLGLLAGAPLDCETIQQSCYYKCHAFLGLSSFTSACAPPNSRLFVLSLPQDPSVALSQTPF